MHSRIVILCDELIIQPTDYRARTAGLDLCLGEEHPLA